MIVLSGSFICRSTKIVHRVTGKKILWVAARKRTLSNSSSSSHTVVVRSSVQQQREQQQEQQEKQPVPATAVTAIPGMHVVAVAAATTGVAA